MDNTEDPLSAPPPAILVKGKTFARACGRRPVTGISAPAQDVCHAPLHSTSLRECGAGRGWRRPALGGSPVGVVQAAGLRGRMCVPPRGRCRSRSVFPSQGGVGLGEGCARVPRCGAGNGCLQVTARPLGPRVPGTASQNPPEAGRVLPALRELPPLLKEY